MPPVHDSTADYRESNFREKMLEHVFVSELLQEAWFRYGMTIEVLHSEVDSAGYDLVLEFGGVIRHVQLKSSRADAKTARQTINMALAQKPSGCVVWVLYRTRADGCRVELSYRFFGNGSGEPLPSLQDRKIARHTKANAQGIKAERPALRVLTRADFSAELSLAELMVSLFGEQMIVTTAEAENRPTAEPGQTSSGLDQQR